MKRIIAIFLVIMLISGCCGCKGKKQTTVTDNSSSSQNSSENSYVPEQNGEIITDDNYLQSDEVLQNGDQSQIIDTSSQFDNPGISDNSWPQGNGQSQVLDGSVTDDNSQNIDTSLPSGNGETNNNITDGVVDSNSQDDATSTPVASTPESGSQSGVTSTPVNSTPESGSQNGATSTPVTSKPQSSVTSTPTSKPQSSSQSGATSTPTTSKPQSGVTSTPATSKPQGSSQGGTTSTPDVSQDVNTSTPDNNSNVENNSSSTDVSTPNNSSQNSSSQKTEKIPGSAVLFDSPIYESFITVDDDDTKREIVPEYGTVPSTLDTEWDAGTLSHKGNVDELADERRLEILNAPNTTDIYDIEGTIYYVSPNGDDNNDGKTPETAFRSTKASIFTLNVLKPGDAVLFERNGLWRLIGAIKCKEGVTYGAYGEGEKPTFFGSAYNYADESFWIPSTKENIWKVTVADRDIGLIVFNHGEIVGHKKLNGLIALEKNGDFYFNSQQDTVYLYCDKGNPGKVFEDIEIALHKNLFQVTNAHNVIIDNLKLKYVGAFGVSACGCDGLTITNCEIGFIGGAIQSGTLRYGNGIQVWNGVVNHRVENCWIYQIYDAALTFQGNDTYDLAAYMSNVYKDITYTNNLIEFATYSFEFWHSNTNSTDQISLAVIDNFNCTNNISRFAGYGFGSQRTDNTGNHICVFNRSFPNAVGNNITDNIFDMADSFITKWGFNAGADMGEWNISNNTYYHGKNRLNEAMRYGSQYTATNQSTLEYAISIFEKNPKLVKWVD